MTTSPDPAVDPTAPPSAPPDPASGVRGVPASRPRGPRISTVIWGVLLLLVAAALLFPIVVGAPIDLQLAAIIALAATGVALLLAAIVSAILRR